VRISALALLLALGSCGYEVDYSGTSYRCMRYPDCPAGFACVCGTCQVADRYQTEVIVDEPVGWWRLGERSGLVAADAICEGDAYYDGAPTLGVPGLLDDGPDLATLFDGDDDEVVTPVTVGTRFTVEALIQPSLTPPSPTQRQGIVGADVYQVSGFRWALTPSGELEFYVDESGGTGSVISAPTIDLGGPPYHVAAVNADGEVTIYVDGMQRGMGSVTAVVGDQVLRIGEVGDLLYFRGVIDEPAVYDRALPEERIRAHAMAAGR